MISKENIYKLNQFAGKISEIYSLKREENKTLVDTYFVVIKLNGKLEVRKVKFHDGSIVEILSGKNGYAIFNIDGRGNKFLRLKSPIYASFEECVSEYEKYKIRKYLEKNCLV